MNGEYNKGIYYQPPEVDTNNYGKPPKKKAWIIVLIIIAILLVIKGVLSVYGAVAYNIIRYTCADNTLLADTQSEQSFAADDVKNMSIDWAYGDISIEYCKDENITVKESSNENAGPMVCTLYNDGGLTIDYIDTNVENIYLINAKKDLTITVPYGTELSEIKISAFGSDVSMHDIVCSEFDYSTIGGDGSFSFKTQPEIIRLDSVSGDISLGFSDNFSGYSLNTSAVSGKIKDKIRDSGDGSTEIKFISVSGDLELYKAK